MTSKIYDGQKAGILFKILKKIDPEDVRKNLDETEVDPEVGISIAEMGFGHIKFEKQDYHVYSARVKSRTIAGNQPFVTPHLHKHGSEPYYFLGKGEINLGKLTKDGKGCEWRNPILVNIGDELLIRENEIHSFRNIGERDSDFLFACPKSHLIDFSEQNPDGDRYIVKQLKNEIPPHYPK